MNQNFGSVIKRCFNKQNKVAKYHLWEFPVLLDCTKCEKRKVVYQVNCLFDWPLLLVITSRCFCPRMKTPLRILSAVIFIMSSALAYPEQGAFELALNSTLNYGVVVKNLYNATRWKSNPRTWIFLWYYCDYILLNLKDFHQGFVQWYKPSRHRVDATWNVSKLNHAH